MPLTELVHYLNRENRKAYGPIDCPGDGLSIGPAGVLAHDGGLLLRSVFQPISAPRSGRIVGHEALLRAKSTGGEELGVSAVFDRTGSPAKMIYLDRLCRTLHALNYLQLAGSGDGILFLNVEPRHIHAVTGGHGLIFEVIIKRCGLSPEHIFLELRAGKIDTSQPIGHLVDALAAYRSRGYRIAIDQATPDFDRGLLQLLHPEMVKFDVRSLERQGNFDSAQSSAESDWFDAAEACRQVGAEIGATHVMTQRQFDLARLFGAEYLQGHHLASPSPDIGEPLTPRGHVQAA